MTERPSGVQMTAHTGEGFEVRLTHGPSGTAMSTHPPKDNGGTGAAFSPTDLVGAALASCAITTMALAASREQLPWGQASAKVEKRMTPPPRQIAELVVELTMPSGLSPTLRNRYEEIARTCPVARSLHPSVRVPMKFSYPD